MRTVLISAGYVLTGLAYASAENLVVPPGVELVAGNGFFPQFQEGRTGPIDPARDYIAIARTFPQATNINGFKVDVLVTDFGYIPVSDVLQTPATANQRVAAAFGGGAGVDSLGQLTAPSYFIQGTTFNNVGDALGALDRQTTINTANIATINTSGTKYYQSNSSGPGASATGTNALAMGSSAVSSGSNAIALGTGAQATQAGAIAVGSNSASTGTNAIAIGTGATATGSVAVGAGASAANGGVAFGDGAASTGANSAAIGPGATATHASAVAIGSGSVTSAANTVSVGGAGSERRITNVASGSSPTDAVNVGQLSSTANAIQSQMGGLQSQIYDNRTEARRGVAAAVATASAPMPSAPGKTTWQIRGSTFQNEFGAGFGFAHRLYTDTPLNIVGGYGNGGGNQHTAYVGVGGEF
jgi:trimeric autotransporter adhesin